MRLYRTALALGALTLSVPMLAQGSRYGLDRSRVERGQDDRKGEQRSNSGDDSRDGGKSSAQLGTQNDSRFYSRNDNGNNGRTDRGRRRNESRSDPRARPDDRSGYRTDRRDDERPDRGDQQRYDRRDDYRYNGRDFRQHDAPAITIWFRDRGLMRTPSYGLRARIMGRDHYDFRPGLFLSASVFSRLDVLPFDLELELGSLPWYLERRVFGRTVLIVDMRTRLVVDVYEMNW